MKHLIISEYGSYLGIDSGRMVVKTGESTKHFPLNRLSTVAIAKKGVSLSSNLVEAFAARGIKLFFLDFRGSAHSMLVGAHQHAVVQARLNQFEYLKEASLGLSKRLIAAKIKNQRATLAYYNKYLKSARIKEVLEVLKTYAQKAALAANQEVLLGFEGAAAKTYFNALSQHQLFSDSFKSREGRGSNELTNSMLNYGYAILSSYVLNAITNAGLEPYLGCLHQKRPGKMALVLDLMEIYRAWVVDRAVVKLRSQAKGSFLDAKLKAALIKEIQATMHKSYAYRKQRVKLEHIIQRQVYRLSGEFAGANSYKPYLFKC